MTALTLTETLSREITSWLGTSSTTMRRSTRTICWTNGTSSTRPGPLVPVYRPSVKTTARSYSRRILIAEATMIKTKTTTMAAMPMVMSMSFPPGLHIGQLHRLHGENEILAADDPDARSRLQRAGRACVPDLAQDPDSAVVALPFHGLALGADHRFAAGDDTLAPGAQQHAEHQQEETAGYDGGGGDNREGQAEFRCMGRAHAD